MKRRGSRVRFFAVRPGFENRSDKGQPYAGNCFLQGSLCFSCPPLGLLKANSSGLAVGIKGRLGWARQGGCQGLAAGWLASLQRSRARARSRAEWTLPTLLGRGEGVAFIRPDGPQFLPRLPGPPLLAAPPRRAAGCEHGGAWA